MRIFAGMEMKRTVWAIALAVFCRMPGSAPRKWEASLAAGLNSDGWEWGRGLCLQANTISWPENGNRTRRRDTCAGRLAHRRLDIWRRLRPSIL